MPSVFPLWEDVIQPSHALPIHFLGNNPTIFLLRLGRKISMVGEAEPVRHLSSLEGMKVKGRSHEWGCPCPSGGVVGQNNGQLLPTTPLHQGQAQNLGWPVAEAHGTHCPITARGRMFPDTV